MHRVLIYPVLGLSLAGGATACSRGADKSQEAAYKANAERALPDRDQVEITGCLTSNADTNQFVLTANATALTSLTNRAGAGETFHYQLVGGNNLQALVGKEVVVKGSVEGKGKDVNIETKEKVEGTPTRNRGEEVAPAIESQQSVEMQVERLTVASVTATGSACQIGQGLGQRR